MPLPNDTLFNLQWYLKNTGQAGGTAGIDINVENVWADYTGTGIRIGIYDDSVQVTHPDLVANYNAALQPVINGVVHAGTPILASDNHGTPVAGIIVGSGNNNLGITGIAYGATFGTARFLGADGTLGQQLLDLQTNFDVTNHSWGSTRSYFADGNGNDQFQSSANNGRGGLGVIMVKAAGNERVGNPGGSEPVGRDANDSGSNTNRYAIIVGATLNTGFVADYSSPGACLLVSAPAGPGSGGLDQDISTDRTGTDGYNNGTTGTPTNQADYAAFNGTSAATPVTSGVAALILQANNTLGWRDVQEIMAYSSRQVGSAIGAAPVGSEADVWAYNAATDWNGGGLHYSNDYGFGMVDAYAAVRLAETWRVGSPVANTSANEQTATATVVQAAQAIPNNTGASITYTFNITGAISIESANINLALNHTAVGDLRIVLISPNGTASDVWRGTNAGTAINTNWTFASREFYGDAANGTWTVTITDNGTLGTGTVGDASLTLYGSTKTANDTYVYTNEFANVAGLGTRNTLTDTGGTDTLNAAAVTAALNINLTAGVQNQIAGQNMTIAAGTVIENLIGGDGNDIFTGNAAYNLLNGARGNDTLDGGAGADTLNGGVGSDTASYFNSNAGVTIALVGGAATGSGGDAAGDILIGIENITGSNGFADQLFGDAGANQLSGLGGNDTLDGGAGADTLIGGAGLDTAYYYSSAAGVIVNLATGTGTGGDAAGDTFVEIEYVVGSNTGGDVLTGQGVINYLNGLGGNDTIDGGGVAAVNVNTATYQGDSLDGGAGTDTLSYATSTLGIVVLMDWNSPTSGIAWNGTTGDVMINFENLTGSNQNDVLLGNDSANIINSGFGTDSLYGKGGADTFHFDALQTDVIADYQQGTDHLRFSSALATSFADFTIYGNGTSLMSVVLNANGSQVVVQGFGLSNITLSASDFQFV